MDAPVLPAPLDSDPALIRAAEADGDHVVGVLMLRPGRAIVARRLGRDASWLDAANVTGDNEPAETPAFLIFNFPQLIARAEGRRRRVSDTAARLPYLGAIL